jgi:hypothetical protein
MGKHIILQQKDIIVCTSTSGTMIATSDDFKLSLLHVRLSDIFRHTMAAAQRFVQCFHIIEQVSQKLVIFEIFADT